MTHKEKILWTKAEWIQDRIGVLGKSKVHGTVDNPMVTISQGMLIAIVDDLKHLADSIPDLHELYSEPKEVQKINLEDIPKPPSQFFNEKSPKYGDIRYGDMSGASLPGSDNIQDKVNDNCSIFPTWHSNHATRVAEDNDGSID